MRHLLLVVIAAESEVHHSSAAAPCWLLLRGRWWLPCQLSALLLGWLLLLLPLLPLLGLLTCSFQRAAIRRSSSCRWWWQRLLGCSICASRALLCACANPARTAVELVRPSQHRCKPITQAKPARGRRPCWTQRRCRGCSHGCCLNVTCRSRGQLFLLRLWSLLSVLVVLLSLPLLRVLFCLGPSLLVCRPCCRAAAVV